MGKRSGRDPYLSKREVGQGHRASRDGFVVSGEERVDFVTVPEGSPGDTFAMERMRVRAGLEEEDPREVRRRSLEALGQEWSELPDDGAEYSDEDDSEEAVA